MKKMYLLIAMFMGLGAAHAQAPAAGWAKNYQITQTSAVTPSINATGITVANGYVYTAGYYRGQADFNSGSGTAISSVVSGGAGYSTDDIYVIKRDTAGELIWVASMGGEYNDYAIALAADANGNVYVTGYYNGTCDFAPGASTVNLNSLGGQDVFVVKLNSTGNLAWAKTFGGGGNDQGKAIKLDFDGNIYIAGNFESTVDFNPDTAVSNEFTSIDLEDVFLLKLDTGGNYVWAKHMEGAGNDYASAMAIDVDDNIYLTGHFNGSLDLNPTEGVGDVNTQGGYDLYWAKYASNGNFIWRRSAGSDQDDKSYAIALDATGNLYATGNFMGTSIIDFGGGTLDAAGYQDVYVLKLATDGSFTWVRQFSGGDNETGYAITIDRNNNVFVAGDYFQTVDFDPGTAVVNLSAIQNNDAFIAKLDQNGAYIWSGTYGGARGQVITALATDANNALYVTGGYSGDITIGGNIFTVGQGADGFDAKFYQGGTPTVGISNVEALNIAMYPNPANNNLYFRNISEDVNAKVYDVTGKLLIDEMVADSQLNVQALSSGYYNIVLTKHTGSQTLKLVIE